MTVSISRGRNQRKSDHFALDAFFAELLRGAQAPMHARREADQRNVAPFALHIRLANG